MKLNNQIEVIQYGTGLRVELTVHSCGYSVIISEQDLHSVIGFKQLIEYKFNPLFGRLHAMYSPEEVVLETIESIKSKLLNNQTLINYWNKFN